MPNTAVDVSDVDDEGQGEEEEDVSAAGKVTTKRRNQPQSSSSIQRKAGTTTSSASISSWAPAGVVEGKERDNRDTMSTPSRQVVRHTPQNSLYRQKRRGLRHMPTAGSSITTIHSNESLRSSPLFRRRLEDQEQADDDEGEGHNEDIGFTDWLTGETLNFLKWTGGVTLSTTGKLVAPPIQLTNSVILPALFTTLVDWIDKITPKRVKDWVRILTASVTHVISVLRNTQRGITFRSKVVDFVGGDILGVLSSDEARQAVVDGMACTVKVAEALHTPEVHDLLQQLSVLGCRLVDVASSGKSKELICDFYDLVWSGMEVMADPETTLALAEVTAYLCHALEMQDAVAAVSGGDGEANHGKRLIRRINRQGLQRRVYGNPDLLSNPYTTVEEVILSSLDRVDAQRTHDDFENDYDISDEDMDARSARGKDGGTGASNSDDIPCNVVLEERMKLDQASDKDDLDTDWKIHARREVDVEYLKGRIAERASALEALKKQTRKGKSLKFASSPKSKEAKERESDEIDESIVEDQDHQQSPFNRERLEGETPVDQFYRILDEYMEVQRQDGTEHVLSRLDGSKLGDSQLRDVEDDIDGEVDTPMDLQKKARRKLNSSDKGEEKDSQGRFYDSIRRRVSKKMVNASVSGKKTTRQRKKFIKWEEHKLALFVGLSIIGVISSVVGGFTMYGAYKFFFPSGHAAVEQAGRMLRLTSLSPASITVSQTKTFAPNINSQAPPPPVTAESTTETYEGGGKNEIVIRIIREVVHVKEDGTIIEDYASTKQVNQDQEEDPPVFPTQEQLDQVADCVSSAL